MIGTSVVLFYLVNNSSHIRAMTWMEELLPCQSLSRSPPAAICPNEKVPFDRDSNSGGILIRTHRVVEELTPLLSHTTAPIHRWSVFTVYGSELSLFLERQEASVEF